MKKILLASLVVVLNLTNLAQASEKKAYIKGEFGLSLPLKLSAIQYGHKKPKNANIMSLGLGYNINNHFSVDGTIYHFTNFKFDHNIGGIQHSQSIKANAVLLNLNLDVYKFNTFSPFVSVGGGMSRNNAGDLLATNIQKTYGKTTDQFAWSIGAGIKAKLHKEIGATFSYKYMDLGRIETSSFGRVYPGFAVEELGTVKSNFKTHNIMLGIQYNF